MVNTTMLQTLLKGYDDISGVYPRWYGIGTLKHKDKDIDSILVLGDSELENRLGVAKGFPNVTLSRNDIIISK